MSTLNERIAALVPRMDGWCTVEKGCDLALAVIKLRAAVSVEIGVFGGRSLLPIALAHQGQDFGVVWAIDPWNPAASVIGQNEVNANWWGHCDHETIYQRFLAHVKTQGVDRYVKIIRQESDSVEPPPVIDLLHIDGNHSDQTIRDVSRFASKVRPGGFCFVDDLHWAKGVETAVDNLLAMGFVKLFVRDTGAMFQREAPRTDAPKKKGGWPKGKKRKGGGHR